MARALLGPHLSDVIRLASGKYFCLATAFYSAARLDATTITAQTSDLMVRLDFNSIDDWVRKAIAPDALLQLWERHEKAELAVYIGKGAHAKIYAGDKTFMIGSANFTVRGLAGTSDEVLWLEDSITAYKQAKGLIEDYKGALKKISIDQLRTYVEKNQKRVKLLQRAAQRSEEDTLPSEIRRPSRLGSYENFLAWLVRAKMSDAIGEILRRAHGAGQLSGHIRMNFFGLRQFLVAHPEESKYLLAKDPNGYRLCYDPRMESSLSRFVAREAADEGGLQVDTWRTYLPERSGGKPKTGGGTSGNLNRMLPLVAAYLHDIN